MLIVTELEYGYNAVMVELRSYLMGDESRFEEVVSVIRMLPKEVRSELLRIAESNLKTWYNMGILDDKGYEEAKGRLNKLVLSLES